MLFYKPGVDNFRPVLRSPNKPTGENYAEYVSKQTTWACGTL